METQSYVIQPYAHLRPLEEAARRLRLHLVYAKPSDVERLIINQRSSYCGLTPLPLIAKHRLPAFRGPMVWVSGCSPSLVLVKPKGLDICNCRIIYVTRESVATKTLVSMALRRLCDRIEFKDKVLNAKLAADYARRGVCSLLIGDEGVKVNMLTDDLEIVEVAALVRETLGLNGFALAATAGEGCTGLENLLARLMRVKPSMLAVLRVAERLNVPIALAERYLRCTRLDYKPDILSSTLRLLISDAHILWHLSSPQPVRM